MQEMCIEPVKMHDCIPSEILFGIHPISFPCLHTNLSLMQEGYADLIGVGRALLADSDWPVKALNGELQD